MRMGGIRLNPWAKSRDTSTTYRFDASYDEIVVLSDGSRARIRPIRPSDKAALAKGFESVVETNALSGSRLRRHDI
jgi:hypothetical protein